MSIRIRSETKPRLGKLATRLNSKKTQQKAIMAKINDTKSHFNSGYLTKLSEYEKQYGHNLSLKKLLNSTKSESQKSQLTVELNSQMLIQRALANDLKKIATQSGNLKDHNTLMHLKRNLINSEQLIANISRVKSQINHAEQQRKMEKAQIIRDKVKKARRNGMTALYRTDMQSTEVFELYETSPSETNSNAVATHSVDNNSIQTNYVGLDSRELSGTYILKGKNLHDADEKYKKLMLWSRHFEFTIDGFSYWQHAYISSIGKSVDETSNSNSFSISITFTYAKQASIKYFKKQKKSHRKAPAKKQRGNRHGSSHKYIRVKPGMTYWQISQKTGVSVSQIMKMNHWPASSLPINAKVRYM